jgi:uncharacterized membrane protein
LIDRSTISQSSRDRLSIEVASAWVLRIGVASAVVVMLTGIAFSFAHGTTSIGRMQSDGFDYRLTEICPGIAGGRGKSIIESGIYLLVLTPVMRVFTSMILFAVVQRDWVYFVITFVVLLMTIAGLVWLG